ncbi:MAG: hypothetical protein V7752_21035 [Halopseudomonas sp.]
MKCFVSTLLYLLTLSLPVTAAYDDGSRYAFLASVSQKSISIVDLQQQKVAQTIELKRVPGAIVASNDMKALVVAHREDKQLTLVDLASARLEQIDYPLSMIPDDIKLGPLGDTLAIYDRQQRVLEVQSVRRRETLVRISDVDTATSFTFSLDGSHVYWIDQGRGELRVSDLWSKNTSLTLSRDGAGLSAMSRSVDGRLGFVSDARAGKVYVIDLKSLTKIKEIYVERSPGRPWGTTDGSTMLIPNRADATLTAISTLTLEALYTVKAVANPVAINVGWLDTTAAVIGENGDVALLDLTTGTVAEHLQFKGLPREGVVTSDSRTLVVSIGGLGSLALFDMRSRSLVREISGLPSDIGVATLAVSNNLCH